MHRILVDYTKNEKEKAKKDKGENKSIHLTNLGLYERIYCPTEGSVYADEEFPYYDIEKDRYYKRQPLDSTDEDFKELLKYFPIEKHEAPTNNSIATILTVIGIINMIVGFFLGIHITGESSGVLGLSVIIYSVFSCFLFLGFAETIKLLTQIKNKLSKKDLLTLE